jgi:hypothetical protein
LPQRHVGTKQQLEHIGLEELEEEVDIRGERGGAEIRGAIIDSTPMD